jgi:hypothetical protein
LTALAASAAGFCPTAARGQMVEKAALLVDVVLQYRRFEAWKIQNLIFEAKCQSKKEGLEKQACYPSPS